MSDGLVSDQQVDLPLPDRLTPTPCFVIFEDGIRRNLKRTAEACGDIRRLMPHVKTHRADWVVRLLLAEGIEAFKCATPAEVEMVLEAGAKKVLWAYPSVNPGNIARVLAAAGKHADAHLTGLVDSRQGLDAWLAALGNGFPNVDLRVDLDPGMGRTGVPMTSEAVDLALAVNAAGRLAGFHVYDGHIKGQRAERCRQVLENAAKVNELLAALHAKGIEADLVGGGSYTFDIWPKDLARYVSPGSWTYSSAQHHVELSELGWEQAAFVLATVTSVHAGTATLDAGSKAISPDKPLPERFYWDRRIIMMSEEHAVVEADNLRIGDRVLLTPQHTCTTAYLYEMALVRTSNGAWEQRAQLGCRR
jgi:D-serine deaminase-like pyridoxal phosphate-dependent protein